MILLVVMTDGRRECIERTIPSFDVFSHPDGRQGFGGAIRFAWELVRWLPGGDRFVLHLEDDFVFRRPVDLMAMAHVLDDEPHLVQLALRRQPHRAPLPKVAFRWQDGAVIHQGNHGVTLPTAASSVGGLEVRHFPYRSVEQFVRKARNGAAAYAATDLPVDVGAHWRSYGELLERYGEEVLHDVFRRHFWFLSPADAGMVLDPAPYCRWVL
jgi:hypothetical protein